MKKYIFISTILIMVALLIPFIAHAATFMSTKKSFGGKVLMTEIPDVTCTGSGTGPVVVIGSSAGGSPYYADMSGKTPKAGGWILGLADYNRDYSTCYIEVGQYRIEFPVTKTNYYGISGSSFF